MQGLIYPKLYILGQNTPFLCKNAKNWKIFVEFIFNYQMVYKFAQG